MTDSLHIVCTQCHAKNRLPIERAREAPTCGRCKTLLFTGKPFAVTDASFDAIVGGSEVPTVVDFWAPWCGPCRQFAPHYEQAADALEPHVRLAKLDTEANPRTSARFQIRSIPTLAIFEGTHEIARMSGALPANQFVAWVAGELKLLD